MAHRRPVPSAGVLALVLIGCAACAPDAQEGAPAAGAAATTTDRSRPGAEVDGSKLAGRVRTATTAARSVRMRTTMPGEGTVSVLDQVRISAHRTDTGGTSDGVRLRLIGDTY